MQAPRVQWAAMSFVDDLASGKHGLVVDLAPHLVMTDKTPTSVTLRDPETDLAWWFFFFPGAHLDLSTAHDAQLVRGIERHTRLLFDSMFDHDRRSEPQLDEHWRRTKDAAWTPVIEIERTEVPGGTALTILHRMYYRPTKEVIMGHTLVPVRGGLFEARWLGVARETGLRESMIMLRRDPDLQAKSFPPQAVYDDPAFDALLPAHVLSVVRAAKRWHVEAGLEVKRPPEPPELEIGLDPYPYAITAPPRFMRHGVATHGGDRTYVFRRLSFAGTDGAERLIFVRTDERIRGIAVAARLRRYADRRTRELAGQVELANPTCAIRPLVEERPVVLAVTEGDPRTVGCGRARTVWCWLIDDTGHVWAIAIESSVAVPTAELERELAGVARSWRRI